MKIVNSKNTWYTIFAVLIIIIITIIVFNSIFKRTEKKLDSTSTDKRETLITQKDTKSSGITYIKASPTPSPKPTKKPFLTLFNTDPKPTPSPSPSPTPNIKEAKTVTTIVEIDKKTTKGNLTASESSNLKMIDEDGVIYLTSENSDGSIDPFIKKNTNDSSEEITPPPGYADDLGEFINKLIRLSLAFASLMVFIQLVLGGLQWLTSGGDKGKVEEARNKITAAVIGLIIVASSFAIFTLVLQSLGIGDINALLESAMS